MQDKSPLRVIFFCGDESPFGRAHLLPLLEDGFSVQAVVVPTEACSQRFRERLLGGDINHPERFRGRVNFRSLLGQAKAFLSRGRMPPNPWSALDATFPRFRIREVCREKGVQFQEIDDVNSPQVLQWLAELRPDLLICAAYPQIFGSRLLEMPRIGGVNFHPSLLPRCRGANPIYWAIASGEKETGVTAHFMTERLDGGDIVAQAPIPIAEEDNYWSVYGKVLRDTPRLVKAVAAFFAEGRTRGVSQDEREATTFREPRKIHRCLFWALRSAAALVNQVRAGEAFLVARGRQIGVRGAGVIPTASILTNGLRVPPGTVIAVGHAELVVAAKDGGVAIREVVYRGRPMNGASLARCLRLHVGENLS